LHFGARGSQRVRNGLGAYAVTPGRTAGGKISAGGVGDGNPAMLDSRERIFLEVWL